MIHFDTHFSLFVFIILLCLFAGPSFRVCGGTTKKMKQSREMQQGCQSGRKDRLGFLGCAAIWCDLAQFGVLIRIRSLYYDLKYDKILT